MTLKEMSNKLRAESGIQVSPQAISKALDGKCYTIKQLHYMTDTMNSDENKRKRKDYTTKILNFTGEGKTLIFIDESNVNLFLRRSIGRARKGERCVVRRPNTKGPNVHMIAAISQQRLHRFERKRGHFRGEDAKEWLRGLLRELRADGYAMNQLVIVADNAPCHSQLEQVSSEEEFSDVTIIRLAPYSAPMNPIEYAWSSIKAKIKSSLSTNFNRPMDDRGGLTMMELRLRRVEDAIDSAIASVNMMHCLSFFNHLQKFYPLTMSCNDLPVGM